jgi:hypothetical protein
MKVLRLARQCYRAGIRAGVAHVSTEHRAKIGS